MQALTTKERSAKVQHLIQVECCLADAHGLSIQECMIMDRWRRVASRIATKLRERHLLIMDRVDMLTVIYRAMSRSCQTGWHRMPLPAPYQHNRRRGAAIQGYQLRLLQRKEAV